METNFTLKVTPLSVILVNIDIRELKDDLLGVGLFTSHYVDVLIDENQCQRDVGAPLFPKLSD
jgi:hypothetical protein